MNTFLNHDKISFIKGLGFLLGYLCFDGIFTQTAYSFQLDITSSTDEYRNGDIYNGNTVDIGDYTVVGGYDTATSLGHIEEVLSDGNAVNDSNSTPITIQTLIDALGTTADGVTGLTSTEVLVFGLGINQRGSSNNVTITGLTMTFDLPDGNGGETTQVFSLGTDSIFVTGYNGGGQNNSEAQFQVNFGFDFIAAYDGVLVNGEVPSSYEYTINTTISGQNSGDESFFLSTGLTTAAQAVPFEFSPTLGILMVGGFLAIRKIASNILFKSVKRLSSQIHSSLYSSIENRQL